MMAQREAEEFCENQQPARLIQIDSDYKWLKLAGTASRPRRSHSDLASQIAGGQRTFRAFPEIHPFCQRQASLTDSLVFPIEVKVSHNMYLLVKNVCINTILLTLAYSDY